MPSQLHSVGTETEKSQLHFGRIYGVSYIKEPRYGVMFDCLSNNFDQLILVISRVRDGIFIADKKASMGVEVITSVSSAALGCTPPLDPGYKGRPVGRRTPVHGLNQRLNLWG